MKCSTCSKAESEDIKLKGCAVCGTAKYCSVECQKGDWASHKPGCTKAGCLLLITAVQQNDGDTVARLAQTKRVLNGKVDYTPLPTDDFPDPEEMAKWTALHECVRLQKVEMMKILIENGADLEIRDADGETAVFVASTARNPEMIKILLDAGANPNAQARDGWSALMMAARGGDYETTKALLEAGASLNSGSDMFGRTALDIVAQQASGQGIRMVEGESYEEATAKYQRLHSLLSEYAR